MRYGVMISRKIQINLATWSVLTKWKPLVCVQRTCSLSANIELQSYKTVAATALKKKKKNIYCVAKGTFDKE